MSRGTKTRLRAGRAAAPQSGRSAALHFESQHLKRYICEFDFRYNTRKIDDAARATEALKGITGKRLTYRRTNQQATA